MKPWATALLFCLCTFAALPGHAAPPDTLTLPDIVGRADRWPNAVTVTQNLAFGNGQRIRQGQSVRVLRVTSAGAQVDGGNGVYFQLTFDQCDLVDAANQAWSALTPAQRAIDPASLVQDPSLWPSHVQTTVPVSVQSGKIPVGTEFGVVDVEGEDVRVMDAASHALSIFPENTTDIFPKARALALIDPMKRPSRVADALRNILVGADGLPHQSRAIDDGQVFVLYYGASWCPPCRAFTPGFTDYIRHAEAGNPHMSVVMVSNDKDEDKMREYMAEEKMPWPAVPFTAANQSPLLTSYQKGAIPTVVIVDRFGRVLFENWAGDQYLDPNSRDPGALTTASDRRGALMPPRKV